MGSTNFDHAPNLYAPKVNWLLMTAHWETDCVDRYGPDILE